MPSFGQSHSEKPVLRTVFSKSNSLYAGMDNGLVFSDTTDWKEYYFKVADSNDEMFKDSQFLDIHPRNYRENDSATIFIKKIKGKDTITVSIQKFPVRRIPDPSLGIGGKPIIDKISKTDILKYKELSVFISEDLPKSLGMSVRSFVIVLDGNEYTTESWNFSKVMLREIKKTNSHRILFKSIYLTSPDGIGRPIRDYDLELIQ